MHVSATSDTHKYYKQVRSRQLRLLIKKGVIILSQVIIHTPMLIAVKLMLLL